MGFISLLVADTAITGILAVVITFLVVAATFVIAGIVISIVYAANTSKRHAAGKKLGGKIAIPIVCFIAAGLIVGGLFMVKGMADASFKQVSARTDIDDSAAIDHTGAADSGSTASATTRSYTITHIGDKPDWDTIPVLSIDNQPWGDPVDIEAFAQVCYSDDALYVHMWAREADIRATYTSADVTGNPYEDSCLEFFFSPIESDARYINIEMNPNCCTGMEIGTNRNDRIVLLPKSDALEATSSRTDDGWEIEYEVPFDLIRTLFPDFEVSEGYEMRANFYKCGNLTVKKHYLTWNPVTSDTPDFHRPQDFGTLIFG